MTARRRMGFAIVLELVALPLQPAAPASWGKTPSPVLARTSGATAARARDVW